MSKSDAEPGPLRFSEDAHAELQRVPNLVVKDGDSPDQAIETSPVESAKKAVRDATDQYVRGNDGGNLFVLLRKIGWVAYRLSIAWIEAGSRRVRVLRASFRKSA